MATDLVSTTNLVTPAPSVAPSVPSTPPERTPQSRRQPAGTKTGWATVAVYLLADLCGIGLALGFARGMLSLVGAVDAWTAFDTRLAIFFAAASLFVGWYQGLYSTLIFHPAAELRRTWFAAIGTAAFFAALQFAVLNDHPYACLTAIVACGLFALAQTFLRAACRLAFGRSSWWGRRVLLVGCGERSTAFHRRLERISLFGLRPVGFVEDFDSLSDDVDKSAYLGPTVELGDRATELNVNLGLVLASGVLPRPDVAKLVYRANTGITQWLIIPDDIAFPSLWINSRDVAGLPTVGVSNHLHSPLRRAIKRLLDLAIVAMILPVLAPVMAVMTLVVRFTSPGNVFYSQERIGRNGRRFLAWKVRTMVQNADEVLKQYLDSSPELRAEWEKDHKLKNDPRITWAGKFLRKASLDELPQVWNVIRGEMSLVGPRPIVEKEIEKYGDIYEQYLMVTPGVTGMWQISGRNNTTYQERLEFDSYYVKNWSLWLDFYILLSTAKVVLLREGAY